MKAVIMAGGKGTRLKPLTCNKPKPMVPIVNRPMMEHIVNLLKQYSFTDLLVTLFYLPESVQNYFGDGQKFGVKMNYFIEETPLGTAGSVKNGEKFLDDTFLVISGDALTDMDLEAAVRFHREKKATATLVLTKVDAPLEYGVVITDQDGKIKRFMEKPGWGEVFSDTVNTGIYILEPKIFNYFQSGQVFDFSKDLFPKLLAEGEPLYGYVAPGYWSDIGNLEQYRQAHYDVLSGKTKIAIPGAEIKTGVWAGEGVELAKDAIVEGPIVLGDYCKIFSNVYIGEYSVIGNNGVLQSECSVKRSILWEKCYIGASSEIRGATLCRNVHFKGRNAVYEGAVLGEDVVLGARTTIKPQVKVWPGKNIDSGTTLNESLIWAKKGSRSLFGNSGINGTVNRELTPEIVVKLGGVFGAHLKPGAKIVVSSDNYRVARVFKRALVAGTLAAGVDVYDLGTSTVPVTRFTISSLGVKGGVHLRLNPQEQDGLQIEFFDHAGLIIDKANERALENAFFSEDFPRVDSTRFGELTFVPQLIEPYLQGLIEPDLKEEIIRKHYKIVADYDSGSISLMLSNVMDQLGIEVINLENKPDELPGQPRTLKETAGALTRMADKVREYKADLGVIVVNNGERLLLLDETGEMIKEEELLAFLSFLVLKYKPAATVPVQVTAPHYIEDLARQFHGKIIRTKANPRSMMEKAAQERLFPSTDGKNLYQPEFDALFSLVKVLELLTRENISLSAAKVLVPKVERGYQEAECPWEVKGRIMRNLFEENKDRQLEMTDGLKVYHDEGWALVLPDAEEPVFKIYTEAKTMEEADALTKIYLNRIQELQVH